MPKQKVKVGQEVKNKCPVCGDRHVDLRNLIDVLDENSFLTFKKLRNVKKAVFECYGCETEFWFHMCTLKITVKKVDKDY